MRDLVGAILRRPVDNKVPVPYVGRRAGGLGVVLGGPGGGNRTQQLDAMGSVSTLFQIVTRLAETTATVRWHLYRTRSEGVDPETPRVEVTRHAAVDLWAKPNEFYTKNLFVETFQQHLDLIGEAYWVVVRAGNSPGGVPLEMWPVRPDRMEPVPHREKYLAGWIYKGPDGEDVPLKTWEVIQLRRPNPTDPYRGMGAVQTLLTDIESARYSAEWNRNFFKNSAEPGGIVEVPTRLSDDEFDELRSRWQEQHQGVANAHRVAILEQGKWVDRKFTMRDMQFRELRDVPRELIREAFGYPVFMLGTVTDVNRATADASKDMFADSLSVPRLERIREAMNSQLLRMYGPTGRRVEWDFDDPRPPNAEQERADFDSKVAAADTLIPLGFDRVDVLKQLGLPDIAVAAAPEPAAPSEPAPPPPAEEDADEEEDGGPQGWRRHGVHAHGHAAHVHDQADPPIPEERDEWDDALDAALAEWERVDAAWREDLAGQVQDRVTAGDLAGLAALAVGVAGLAAGVAALSGPMAGLAAVAARAALEDAARQGVTVDRVAEPEDVLQVVAEATVHLLAAELSTSAGREAVRVAVPGRSGPEEGARVAAGVRAHLAGLTDARPREQLGGALTSAEAAGREAVFAVAERVAPSVAYYSDEIKDRASCQRCLEVDGKWLGNSLADVMVTYPTGGYVNCLGRLRCRGRVRAVYRPERTGDGDAAPPAEG